MNNKFAFDILKALEMYALSKQEDVQAPINNYDLILMIPTGHHHGSPRWNLILQANSDWLLKDGMSEVLTDLFPIFDEKKLQDFSSENFIYGINLINEKDRTTAALKRLNYTFGNGFKYLDRVSNIEFREEHYNEAYILKSKILDKIKFGTKQQLLQRQYDSYDSAYFSLNINPDAIPEHIIIGVDGYNLLALNEKGIKKYDTNQALSNQEFLMTDEFTIKISLYDIFDIMPTRKLVKSAA